MRALLLRVGRDAYAVPIESAREVVASPAITHLPTAPASVLGICNVRGEIVPVFDLGILLGLGPLPSIAAMAIVETGLGAAGLAISEMAVAVELGEEVAATDGPGTVAAFACDDGLAVLVDVDTLLTPTRVG
jgi:chemotaxis signal transduction protein